MDTATVTKNETKHASFDVQSCEAALAPLRQELLAHPLFSQISDVARLRTLMESHVFAVWDFMSLLKRLQADLTCVRVPWTYPADSEAARIVNEIVLGEETDVGLDGKPTSHLELYLLAMKDVGADTRMFRKFHDLIVQGRSVEEAMAASKVPSHVRDFVRHTMAVAQRGSTADVLGNFFFAREDLIPEMFSALLRDWGMQRADVPALDYYLNRHIELDADEHGPAARRAIERFLRGGEPVYRGVLASAERGLRARKSLWDGVLASINVGASAAARDGTTRRRFFGLLSPRPS